MEGVYLYENSIDPYMGDIFHENPVILTASWWLLRNFAGFISFVYILLDVLTGLLIYHSTKKITKKNVREMSRILFFVSLFTCKLKFLVSQAIHRTLIRGEY